jgi:hypothetical protein
MLDIVGVDVCQLDGSMPLAIISHLI